MRLPCQCRCTLLVLVVQAIKRPRLIWTATLHRRFVDALDKCGGVDKALPKAIMKVGRGARGSRLIAPSW